MNQSLLLKVQGLYTFPNRLSTVPNGALLVADNIFINRDNVAESRRGLKIYGNAMGTASTHTAHQLFTYKSRVFRHLGPSTGTTLEYDSDGAGTFNEFSFTLTGDTTNGLPTVTNLSTTANLFVGMFVSGTGIPTGTTISAIASTSSITLSANATATNAGVTLTFKYHISEVELGLRIKSIEQSGNLYFTTSDGIRKISVTSASDLSTAKITRAGGIKALDLSATFDATSSFFSANSVVAYRFVWGIKDANTNLILGTPSSRVVVRNTTGATGSVDIEATIPKAVTTSYFYQLYRTTVTSDPTGDVDPGDEEGLVYENNPTQSEINAGSISFTDITPDEFVGANLYTNENSGEGILQANDIPPLCKDITTFKDYTIYANTSTRQRLFISLLSVDNFVDNVSTLTITDGTNSKTFTFTTGAENPSTQRVHYETGGTPGENVEATARSLIRIINKQTDAIVNGFYLSGPEDIPGQMLLEGFDLSQVAFYLNVNDSATTGINFSPNIKSSGQEVISDNEVCPNRLYYSKFQQPEAVPLVNYIDIGPKDKEILRVVALRDNLFVLKEEGVYRLSGLVAPFQVYPFDFSTTLKAPDSAVVLNNLIYCFTDQGIGTISDTGVAIISRPIEGDLLKLQTPQYTNFTTATFGLAYESDRSYYLSTVTETTDTYATQTFRFNTFTNTWTRLDWSKRCATVNTFDDKLYAGPTDTNFIEQERKLFDRTDFADRQFTLSVTAASDVSIGLSSVSDVTIGDVLVQTQYLTINQFNRLLYKLDSDPLLADTDYYSLLNAAPGANLSTQLDLLITKIANDTGRTSHVGFTPAATYTALEPTGAGFSTQQTTFNSLITLLNADVGVGFSTYKISSGTVEYELPVLGINRSTSIITTSYVFPLIVGPVISYQHIVTDLQFVPQTISDTSITKQVSEGTFIFEDSSFTSAIISYSSDLSGDFEENTIEGNGTGTFGNFIYGQGIYGGNGSGIPFRTYIPRNKQRCRYLNCRFRHVFAREIFSLYGISLSVTATSQKGYR